MRRATPPRPIASSTTARGTASSRWPLTSGTTTTTSYIGSLEEISTTGSSTTTTATYGGLALSVNGALSYTLSDRLGSVSAAVNTSGTVTATQLYGPYGGVRYSNGSLPGTRAYTGQRADAAIGAVELTTTTPRHHTSQVVW